MIFHPGILALVLGASVVFVMTFFASVVGVVIALRWDLNSSSAYQLILERRTYLVSTIIKYALVFQTLSVFLFLYVVEDIHVLFVGAMCATGSLNANVIGWYALISKICAFFFSGFWVALNSVDQMSESYPLVRLKYILLIILLPLLALDLFLQMKYFFGLDPHIITSCCGSLFSESGKGAMSDISSLPVKGAMIAFYLAALLYAITAGMCLYSAKEAWRYFFSFSTASFFVLSLAGIISFVSIYIYELPTHHCPFDIIKQEYHFIGYPLYFSLFGAAFCGFLPGIFQPLKKIASLKKILVAREKRWVCCSLAWGIFFLLLVTFSILSSNLSTL